MDAALWQREQLATLVLVIFVFEAQWRREARLTACLQHPLGFSSGERKGGEMVVKRERKEKGR